MSDYDRQLLSKTWLLNDCFQYFQDIQGLAENDRVAVQIGPSRDFPDITAWMSEMIHKSDVFQFPLSVWVAAKD